MGREYRHAARLSSPEATQTRRPAIVAARRRQGPIFVAGAVFGGRPQNGLGWLAGLAGLAGWAGWLAGWAYKGGGCSAPKDSLPFGRGPRAVGPQPIT